MGTITYLKKLLDELIKIDGYSETTKNLKEIINLLESMSNETNPEVFFTLLRKFFNLTNYLNSKSDVPVTEETKKRWSLLKLSKLHICKKSSNTKIPVAELPVPNKLKYEYVRIILSNLYGEEDTTNSSLFLFAIKLKKSLGENYRVFIDESEIFYPLKVRLMPDYSEALFWDENELGCCVGDSEILYNIIFPEYIQNRLKLWYDKFEEITSKERVKRDFSEFTEEAISICRLIKKEYKDLIEIKYWKPYEDPNCDIERIIEIV